MSPNDKLLRAIFAQTASEKEAQRARDRIRSLEFNALIAGVAKRPHTHYGDKGQPLWWVPHGVNDYEGQGYYTREGEKYIGIAADPSTCEEIRPYETPKRGQWLNQYRGERGDWYSPNTEEPMEAHEVEAAQAEAKAAAEAAALAAKIEAARAAKAAAKAAKAVAPAAPVSPFAALAGLKL